MARGTSLSTLFMMLRAECGHSTSVAAGIDNEASLLQKLQRTQIMLYDEYDWPFMMNEWEIPMAAGVRYYDFPTEVGFSGLTAINLEGVIEAWIDYSGRPIPLMRGIGQFQYAQYNSNAPVPDQADPVRAWDIKRSTDDKEQIEVWPIPSGNTNILWLAGKKKLRPLVAASDVADLDDQLIVLTAAAEILARQKSADASKVEAAAAARLKQLKSATKGGTRMITLTGRHSRNSNFGKTIIRIGSTVS